MADFSHPTLFKAPCSGGGPQNFWMKLTPKN